MPNYPMPPYYSLLALLWRFSLRILFFLHFQRILPRFFQFRELRFIVTPSIGNFNSHIKLAIVCMDLEKMRAIPLGINI